MCPLIRNVLTYGGNDRLAYRKCAVSCLPLKITIHIAFRFDPFGRTFFYLFPDFCQGVRAMQRKERVNMIGHPTNLQRGTLAFVKYRCEICMQFRLYIGLNQGRAMFRAENNVNQNGRQRLRHEIARTIFRLAGLMFARAVFPARCAGLLNFALAGLSANDSAIRFKVLHARSRIEQHDAILR
jgi:hypothetical protein